MKCTVEKKTTYESILSLKVTLFATFCLANRGMRWSYGWIAGHDLLVCECNATSKTLHFDVMLWETGNRCPFWQWLSQSHTWDQFLIISRGNWYIYVLHFRLRYPWKLIPTFFLKSWIYQWNHPDVKLVTRLTVEDYPKVKCNLKQSA